MLAETSMNDNAVRDALMSVDVAKINEYLQSGKLDINKKFQFKGRSIWHYLALSKKQENITLLGDFLRFYIDEIGSEALNYQDEIGWSPVHMAADCENIDAIKLFVEYGANPYLLSELQKTPKDIYFNRTHRIPYSLEEILTNYDRNSPPVREPKPAYLKKDVEIKTLGLCLKAELPVMRKRSLSDISNNLLQKTATIFRKFTRSSTYQSIPSKEL